MPRLRVDRSIVIVGLLFVIYGLAGISSCRGRCSNPLDPGCSATTTTTTTIPTTTVASTTTSPTTSTSTSTTTSPTTSTSTSTTTSSTTTVATTTTTVSQFSFEFTVFPQMTAPPLTPACGDSSCHGGLGGSRFFNDSPTAFTFATFGTRSSLGANSTFLRKPAGQCTSGNPCSDATSTVGHSGGTQWPSGSPGFNAALNWINNGRPPEHLLLTRSLGIPRRIPRDSTARTGALDRLADSLLIRPR